MSWFFGSAAERPEAVEVTERKARRAALDKFVALDAKLQAARERFTEVVRTECEATLNRHLAPPAAAATPADEKTIPTATPASATVAAPAASTVTPIAGGVAPAAAAAAGDAKAGSTAAEASVVGTPMASAAAPSIKVGDAVDAVWVDYHGHNHGWWEAHVVRIDKERPATPYGVLYYDATVLKFVAASQVRPRTPAAKKGQSRFPTVAQQDAWRELVTMLYAADDLASVARLLVQYAGMQLKPGHHVWVSKRVTTEGSSSELHRHRVVQTTLVGTAGQISVVADPLPIPAQPTSGLDAATGLGKLGTSAAAPTCTTLVDWRLSAGGQLTYIPSFADVLGEPTLDDVALVRAFVAVTGPKASVPAEQGVFAITDHGAPIVL